MRREAAVAGAMGCGAGAAGGGVDEGGRSPPLPEWQ